MLMWGQISFHRSKMYALTNHKGTRKYVLNGTKETDGRIWDEQKVSWEAVTRVEGKENVYKTNKEKRHCTGMGQGIDILVGNG